MLLEQYKMPSNNNVTIQKAYFAIIVIHGWIMGGR